MFSEWIPIKEFRDYESFANKKDNYILVSQWFFEIYVRVIQSLKPNAMRGIVSNFWTK